MCLVFSACLNAELTRAAAPKITGGGEIDRFSVQVRGEQRQLATYGFAEFAAIQKSEGPRYFVAVKGGVRVTRDTESNLHIDYRETYFQFGTSTIDLQIGRFEAINLFPLGKDTVVSRTGVSRYEANLVRGYPGSEGNQVALHARLSDRLFFELDTMFGDNPGFAADRSALSGIRPSVSYRNSDYVLTLGMEKVDYIGIWGNRNNKTGYALTSTVDFERGDLNLSATVLRDRSTFAVADAVTTYGVNWVTNNWGAGAGLIWSEEQVESRANPTELTVYAAYSFPLTDSNRTQLTVAASYSRTRNYHIDSLLSLKLRLSYYVW